MCQADHRVLTAQRRHKISHQRALGVVGMSPCLFTVVDAHLNSCLDGNKHWKGQERERSQVRKLSK